MFNVGSYIKESAKTVGQRIADDAINQAINNLPISSQGIASTAARALLGIGASTDSIDTFTRSIVDDIFESTINEFYSLAGGDVGAARSRSADMNTNAFLADVNPTTKIAKSQNSDLEVIVVV